VNVSVWRSDVPIDARVHARGAHLACGSLLSVAAP
jgi:hypothetical protein